MRAVMLWAILVYQRWIRKLRGNPVCRFLPSCSDYALEAVTCHGAWRGSRYAFVRLLRCQPFCRGGFDPVPAKEHKGMGD